VTGDCHAGIRGSRGVQFPPATRPTMDTVTLIRSAIRQLLQVADAALEAALRAVLVRDDDYRAGSTR